MNRVITHNYHTHTTRCGHAVGTEREYVEAAIAAGFTTLGFADHVPYPYMKDDYYSNYRMKPEQTDDYVSTISALKEEYKDKIEILTGYEAEYYPDVFDAMIEHVESHGCDYLILGQHFIDNSRELWGSTWGIEREEYLAKYVELCVEGLKTGKYKYLCHPDVFKFTGDDAIFDKHYRELCREVKKLDIPLEINLWGIVNGMHYPSDRFFRIAAEEGNRVIMGCDAHASWIFGNQEYYEKAFEIVERNGLTLQESF